MSVKRTGQPSFVEALMPRGAGRNVQLDRLEVPNAIELYPPCRTSQGGSSNSDGKYRLQHAPMGHNYVLTQAHHRLPRPGEQINPPSPHRS